MGPWYVSTAPPTEQSVKQRDDQPDTPRTVQDSQPSGASSADQESGASSTSRYLLAMHDAVRHPSGGGVKIPPHSTQVASGDSLFNMGTPCLLWGLII